MKQKRVCSVMGFFDKRVGWLRFSALFNVFLGILLLIPIILIVVISILSVTGEIELLFDILPTNWGEWIEKVLAFDIEKALAKENLPNWINDILAQDVDKLLMIGSLVILGWIIFVQLFLNGWLLKHTSQVTNGVCKLALGKALLVTIFSFMWVTTIFVLLLSFDSPESTHRRVKGYKAIRQPYYKY